MRKFYQQQNVFFKNIKIFSFLIIFVWIINNFSIAQNNQQNKLMINPYDLNSVPYNQSNEFFYGYGPSLGSGSSTSGLNGEYLFTVPYDWWQGRNNKIQFYYRIENVSFPFMPACFNNCEGTTNRLLTTGENLEEYYSPYAKFGSKGLSWDGVFAQRTPFFEFKSEGISLPSGLNSQGFISNGFFTSQKLINRTPFPHSVLKHTIYLYCVDEKVFLDSLTWIYDNTRGTMKKYPFSENISVGMAPAIYDVIFLPTFLHHECYNNDPCFSNYLQEDNATWYCFDQDISNCSGTINYYPIEDSYPYENKRHNCGENCNPLFSDQSLIFPPQSLCDFFHPAPYTILWAHLLNFQKNSLPGHINGVPHNLGIEHTYQVGGFDITQINPYEKEFYNPSEVLITSPLTFPCGYTFRTVYGRLPERNIVEQYQVNHQNLYPDIRRVPAPIRAEEQRSIYQVNSTLTIESNVKIMDADLFVNQGGTLIYDPNKTYGNFNIINNGGTVIVQNNLPDCNCKIKCFEPSFYTLESAIIDNDEVWEPYSFWVNGVNHNFETITVSKDIIINKGCTLTIRNATIKFGHFGSIIVKPGAHLIVENSILSSACEMQWKGIVLEKQKLLAIGTPSIEFLATIYISNSEIENANIGILSSTKHAKTSYPGGRIIAENSTFRNNNISIYLEKEKLNSIPLSHNRLIVDNCIFETNNRLYENIHIRKSDDNFTAFSHIKLENSNRIQLRNNQFLCNTEVFQPHERPIGIFSFNSSFITNYLYPNVFSGLKEGILATHSGTPDYIKIDGMEFNDCIHSLVLEGTNYTVVQRSQFNIPPSSNIVDYTNYDILRGYNKPVGIYIRESDNFIIQGNEFKAIDASSSENSFNLSYGIVANSIGSNSGIPSQLLTEEFEYRKGLIFYNTFLDNSISIQSELNNYGYSDLLSNFEDPILQLNAGLSISCNLIEDSKVSGLSIIGLLDFSNYPNNINGKLRDQINWVSPSNNLFKGISDDIFFDVNTTAILDNSYIPLKYYYPQHSSNTNGYRLNPTTNNNLKLNLISTYPYAEFGCLLKIKDTDIWAIQEEIDQINSDISAMMFEYTSIIDGGQTQTLLDSFSFMEDEGMLVDILLGLSPFLSDTILIAVINPYFMFSDISIEEIIIANSPISHNVLHYLNLREPAIPEEHFINIFDNQIGVSERDKEFSRISSQISKLDLLFSDLHRMGVESNSMESIISILIEKDTLNLTRRFERLYNAYYENCEYIKADSMLSDILRTNNIDTADYEVLIRQINMYLQNDTIANLEPRQILSLENYVNSSPETAFKSKSILSLMNNQNFKRDPLIGFVIERNIKQVEEFEKEFINVETTSEVVIYPNPTSDKIFISCSSEKNFFVKIYNLTGVLVYENNVYCNEYIDLFNFSPGFYILKVIQENDSHKSFKIIKN